MAVEGPRIFDSEPDTDTAFDIVDVLVSEILKDVPAYWFEDPEFTWLQYFNWGWSDPDGPDMDAATVCEHLDSGVGDQLFARYRAAETDETGWSRMEGRHTTVILGAMMMQVGAKISDEDLDHLRALLHEDDAEDHLTPQGRLQVLAALDNYKAGIPRDFLGPSCDNCGKTRADTTEKLRHCKRCIAGFWTGGWSCSQDCSRAHRNYHRRLARAERARAEHAQGLARRDNKTERRCGMALRQ